MTLHSYRRVWDVKKKIYGFQNIRLPLPVEPRQIGYFAVSELVILVLRKLIPVLSVVPALALYGLIPYLITRFLMKKKLDGKPPQKFFIDYVQYLFDRGNDIEFFRKPERESKDIIRLNWKCSGRIP